MSRTANRFVSLIVAGSAALLTAMPAVALTRADQPVQGWSAMQNTDVATLLDAAQDMPLSEVAINDQPYCAVNAEIHQTLNKDFNESRIDSQGHAGTELWGSDQMGTWTLVAPRGDDTSCIIASGIGFDDQRDLDVYYVTAGLK